MPFDFVAPFLRRPRTDYTPLDTAGDIASVERVIDDGGLIFEQKIYDGTGEISLKVKEFRCPTCGAVAHFQSVVGDGSAR